MEYKIFESKQNEKVYRIEEDLPDIGAYLYIFEKENCINDYLQNNIENCKLYAYEEFGVPLESWSLVDDKE